MAASALSGGFAACLLKYWTFFRHLGPTLSVWPGALACGVLLVALVGCGGSSADSGGSEDSNIQSIANAYSLFLKQYRQLPANEKEFKKFVERVVAEDAELKAKNLTVDQLMISQRDGKPFGVNCRDKPPPVGSIIAVYERAGVGGSRLIADTAGNVKEVDDVSFRELVPNAR
jgi:hypothetical protein